MPIVAPPDRKLCRILSGLLLAALPLVGRAATGGAVPAPASDGFQSPPEIRAASLKAEREQRAKINALYSQALRIEERDSFEAALSRYLDVLKADPRFVDLQLRVARHYIHLNRPSQAESQLQAALKASPKSAQIKALLAFTCRLKGNQAEALRLAQEALTASPELILPYRVIVEIHRDRKDYAAATEFLKSQLNRSIPSAEFWTGLARLYTENLLDQGNFTAKDVAKLTLPFFRKALDSGPPTAEVLTQVARVELTLGDQASAINRLRAAVDIEQDSVEILHELAKLEQSAGETDTAISHYEAAYRLQPNLPQLRENLARIYLKAGRNADAVAVLDTATEKAAFRSDTFDRLGGLYEEAKSLPKAEICYDQALRLSPDTLQLHLKLAWVQFLQKKATEALNTITAARTRFPTSARLSFLEALSQRQLKNYPAALDAFTRTREFSGTEDAELINGNYYLELATTQELAGQKDKVEATLREGLKMEPNHENILNTLAYFFVEQNTNLPEAQALSQKSLEISPGNGAFLDTLGWIYFKQNKFAEALPLLKQAATATSQDPVVLDHVGDALAALGRKNEALEQWNQVIAQEPENTRVAGKIKALQASKPGPSANQASKSP